MDKTFVEMKLFQVKPDKLELFETKVEEMFAEQMKCVKYYSFWEFDSKENYGKAIKSFFEKYNKDLQKLLIAPFDINLGYTI